MTNFIKIKFSDIDYCREFGRVMKDQESIVKLIECDSEEEVRQSVSALVYAEYIRQTTIDGRHHNAIDQSTKSYILYKTMVEFHQQKPEPCHFDIQWCIDCNRAEAYSL